MSGMVAFEPMPDAPPRRAPGRESRIPTAVRRRQLARARRSIGSFRAINPQQARLQGVALAMIAYIGKHWCEPRYADDFDRWIRIVAYYDRVLRWPKLAGNKWQACEALRSILNQNQFRPSDF